MYFLIACLILTLFNVYLFFKRTTVRPVDPAPVVAITPTVEKLSVADPQPVKPVEIDWTPRRAYHTPEPGDHNILRQN